MADFWADGQMISMADDSTDAANVCREVLGFWPAVVRPWTRADQQKLDAED